MFAGHGNQSHITHSLGNDALGEREQKLKSLVEKAKQDKEKALRILIKIAGKDVIDQFLERNAGAPDVLDRLEEYLADM